MATFPPPPVNGLTPELWRWLREPMAVRPTVVARVRAALAAGERTSADDVALAIIRRPYRDAVAAS